MAEIATGNQADALDVLQDAMYKLVQKYAGRDPADWGPLFQTILQSRIKDFHRRNAVRNRYRVWFGRRGEDDDYDPVESAADVDGRTPDEALELDQGMKLLDEAVRQLPARQQQAFMLRALEGLDVEQTARVMQCSQGSVKTHYFRALAVLRKKLEAYR